MLKETRILSCLAACLASVIPAKAKTFMPDDFVRLRDLTTKVVEEIRYGGADNFTGEVVPGYEAQVCWLRKDMAEALAEVADALDKEGWRLVVYDCYRPTDAVAAFVRWSKQPETGKTKADYYPNIDKKDLFKKGYIATKSVHSTGLAVDAGAFAKDGSAIDFGTHYDFLDVRSHTVSDLVSAPVLANRMKLKRFFEKAGFENYRREWWHFSFKSSIPGRASNAPVTQTR